MMTKKPASGVVWQVAHYLVGLQRLGYEPYYVEAHANTPTWFIDSKDDDGSAGAAAFIAGVMKRFGLGDRWAFHALHSDGRCYGMSHTELQALYASADLIINLHGATVPLPEHAATGRLVFLETDPVALQIELYENSQHAVEYLQPHVAFFTFGENYGNPSCKLPVDERFHFLPTRQPVVLDFWQGREAGPRDAFTTIGNWQQLGREVVYQGETYYWSKHLEFLKFLDVPALTGQSFELALGKFEDADRELLEGHGWRVRSAYDLTMNIDTYRDYIEGSRGEFTVAKDQNVRLNTGWFSDRSATYLAAGRPVITQETGFSEILPTGNGLFSFKTAEDVRQAVEAINADYEHHSRAAYEVAREYFNYDVVLKPILEHMGV